MGTLNSNIRCIEMLCDLIEKIFETGWIVTLDVLKLKKGMGIDKRIMLNSNIRCIEIVVQYGQELTGEVE